MFNSTILDVAIGLVFCFASVALLVSALNEAIASMLKLRHRTLLEGVKKLLNDPNASGLALGLYNHALVNPLSAGKAAAGLKNIVTPAYIPSKDFACALVDVLQKVPGDFAALQSAVGTISDPQLKQVLQGFLARAKGDLAAFQSQVADWFDNAMDRLSGSYKRRSQLITFILGFVVAVAFNIDSFYVLSRLWARPSLAAAISSPAAQALISRAAGSPPTGLDSMGSAESAASAAISSRSSAASPSIKIDADSLFTTLGTLPVGWSNARSWPTLDQGAGTFALSYATFVVGLAVTASAAVFGAPFWFDLLQRLIQVRGTGARPPSNRESQESASSGPRTS